MTFYEATVRARALLIDAGISPDTATRDADLLARHALQWDLATWLARRGEPATERFVSEYQTLIGRRTTREPVAYIRGRQEFWGRDFEVSSAVLIPRPETELLVERALAHLQERSSGVVVDVGTGSGCIGITLALEQPSTTVYATDISDPALAIAKRNAERLGVSSRIRFLHGAWLASVPRPIDLIVSNPPYVAERVRPALSPEVREYEPGVALFGGEDGWRGIQALLAQASEALSAGGVMLIELGYGQFEQLGAEVAAVPGLKLDTIDADLQGIPRVATITRA